MEAVRKKILIVEDEGIIAIDLRRRLVQAGYEVTGIATDSSEALAAVERELPDLVLMDIRLRGPEDGVQTAERIRERFHLPIVYVTAHADADTLERAKATEPFGYIVKPFTGINFHAQIEMALWKHAMERRLRASEAWLAATFRNTADALITTDAEGNIALMNGPAAQLTGWEPEQAKGKGLFEVFQVFDAKTHLPAIHPLEAVYDERQVDTGSAAYELYTRDGANILIEAEISVNRDAEGLLLGLITAFRDITERRLGEERVRHVEKASAIALLATGLSAELGQNLANMEAPLTQMLQISKGKTLRSLGDLQEYVARQKTLVGQLRWLGSTDRGPTVTLQLNGLINSMEGQLRKVLGTSRPLHLGLASGLAPIEVEVEELRENLLRLVVEAREAMPYGGQVDIETQAVVSGNGKRQVQLSIRDRGKGIRANVRGRVFEPYYPLRPGNRSCGMSLALVQRFVVRNGGSVDIDAPLGSERGTAFILRFPVAAASRTADGTVARGLAISSGSMSGGPHGGSSDDYGV